MRRDKIKFIDTDHMLVILKDNKITTKKLVVGMYKYRKSRMIIHYL